MVKLTKTTTKCYLVFLDFTVCILSIVQAPDRENVKHLVITRLRRNNQSLVLRLTLPNEEDEEDCMEQEFQVTGFKKSCTCVQDFTKILHDMFQNHI